MTPHEYVWLAHCVCGPLLLLDEQAATAAKPRQSGILAANPRAITANRLEGTTNVCAIVFFNMGPLFAILPRIVGSKRLGLAIGLHNMFASAGAFTIPIVFGYFRDITGTFTPGWFTVVILLVIGALVSMNLRHY